MDNYLGPVASEAKGSAPPMPSIAVMVAVCPLFRAPSSPGPIKRLRQASSSIIFA